MIGKNRCITIALYIFFSVSVATGAAQSSSAPAKKAESAKASPSKPSAAAGRAADWRQIKKPELPAFHPQEPKRIQFSNGMIVFLQEDHELPLIDGTAYIRGGSRDVPAAKTGLTSIYASSWRTGGTKSKTGDQLDDELEARAAHVETGGGAATTSVSFSCLKGDFDFVFDVFKDVLRNPEFRQDKIDLAKNRMRTAISRRNDDISEIAGRESAKIAYGRDNPYARQPEYATVNAITRQDLFDWHTGHVHPNSIIFGIVGDFDSAAMEKRLRDSFESWVAGPNYVAPQIQFNEPKAGIYFVNKDDVNQSTIHMVKLGIRRDNPDYFSVQVMNDVFGGGFASRLFKRLRTEAGLAYDVGGGIGAAYDHPGLLNIEMGTKSATTVEAIQGLYREVDDMRNNPVTKAELQHGKDSILNSFIFNFDTPEKVLLERMTYELYGYPADFLEKFRAGIEQTSAEDVDRVARKYLIKDQLAVLVVGKAAEFDKPLSALGPITNVDITIPSPEAGATPSGSAGAAAAPPTATSNAEGKALLTKVIDAHGGAQRLAAVKSTHRKATVALKTPQGEMTLESDSIEMLPDKVRLQLQTPNGEFTMVSAPDASFVQLPNGVQPMPTGQRQDLLKSLQRSVWNIAQHANDPKYSFAANGVEQVGDLHASVLDIQTDLQKLRWYVDAKSGRILRAQFEATTQAGPATRVVDYSEWKTVDGITVPFHEEASDNGEPSGSVKTNTFQVNPQMDAKIFAKPGGESAQKAAPR
jgi:zinc protease